MDAQERIKQQVTGNPVVLYMKGTPQQPQCGFSSATVQLFRSLGIPFETRDILANPELRAKVPEYSNWPTFPQVFVGGKLIGGCDIVHEMHERGELEPLIKTALKS